ncbi:MAG: efflux RND transporter periplasmic adaptor subunit [Deltaproteobacteria bacterium]|nr:MAG: efflux RND transporter periplasmic adaptor subunit [Deltaproteobacteria bacterium]
MDSTNRKTRILRFVWGIIPWIIVALIVVFIVTLGGRISEKKARIEKEKRAAMIQEVAAVRVITLTLKPERLVDKINLPAQVEPYKDVWVKAEVSGQVVEVLVEEGQNIEKGELIIQLDDRDYRNRLARIEANSKLAELTYNRTDALVKKQLAAPSKLDEIEAQLKDLTAQHNEAKLALSRTSIATPLSSVLNEIKAKKGDFVGVGDPVAQILEIDPVKVTVGVPESDVASIFDLREADVIIEALGKLRVKGKKIYISRQPKTLSRLFELELKVPNPDGRILPGMFARAELVKHVFNRALSVPLYAIITEGDERFVFLEKEGRAVKRRVTLGTLVDWRVHITTGLKAGEKVIVVGHRLLDEGQAVEVIENVSDPTKILRS